MERGTLNVLRQGPRGPYYNHQCYEEGRNVSRYVPAERVDEIREAIQGYHRCSVPRFFRELFPFGFVVKREGLARC